MKHLYLIFVFTLFAYACDDNTLSENDPCEGISCNDHGTCEVDDEGEAYCACEQFWTWEFDNKLTCVPEDMNDKPVIYLYPTAKTQITVAFEDRESVSLAHTYPAYGRHGWCVNALPDGTLYDCATGMEYYALYWEGGSPDVFDLNTGYVVPGDETIPFLEEKLAVLGLSRREANEFIMYWLPILERSPYNFIHFAQKQWEESVPLVVDPKPDSSVRFLMLYSPLQVPFKVLPQRLTTPKRTGFVLVEWGGRETTLN